MNFDLLARELLRALRGKRSQVAFSRKLGYRTNVAYTWEAGRRMPRAGEALRAAARVGADPRAAAEAFLAEEPTWLRELGSAGDDATWPRLAAGLLRQLARGRAVTELARQAGLPRSQVSRWLGGRTEPRLPDFLRLIESMSGRLPDLLVRLVDASALPSMAEAWATIEARRRTAWEMPASHAVLRALELEAYARLDAHVDEWIAARAGLSAEEVIECLRALEQASLIRRAGGRYEVEETLTDLGLAPEESRRRMRLHWNEVARQRIAAGMPGQFSVNVFTVSEADLERLTHLHMRYFDELRAIVADSGPAERVVLAHLQLIPLDLPGPSGENA